MVTVFNVRELSYPCVLRRRGLDASKKLVKRISTAKDVEVDLHNVEIISLSFLDELIFRTYLSGKLESVVFRVHDRSIEEKLERISAIRALNIKYRFNDNDIRKAALRGVVKHTPSFAESKSVSA